MIQFALTVPLDKELRVSREIGKSVDIDVDALTRLVAIANTEGLYGRQICGVLAIADEAGQNVNFNFEYVDYSERSIN